MGGVTVDEGVLNVTLFRGNPPALTASQYFNMLSDREIPTTQAAQERIVEEESAEHWSRSFIVDRAARVALSLTVSDTPIEQVRLAALAILNSLKVDSARLDAHFHAIDQIPITRRTKAEENLRVSNQSLIARGFDPVTLGHPSRKDGETFFLVELQNTSRLYRVCPLMTVSLEQASYLVDKFHRVGGPDNLIWLLWSSERKKWITPKNSYLKPFEFAAAQLHTASLDKKVVHVFPVHYWPLDSKAWTDASAAVDAKQATALRERIESFFPYIHPGDFPPIEPEEEEPEPKAELTPAPPRLEMPGPAPEQQSAGSLYPVTSGTRWGYMDSSGAVIHEYQFDKAEPFSESLALVQQDGKWQAINPSGRVLFTLDRKDVVIASPFSCGLSRIGYGTWSSRATVTTSGPRSTAATISLITTGNGCAIRKTISHLPRTLAPVSHEYI
jgi:hypothetical protein